MKSARVDFTKGINAIVNKGLQNDGWMAFIDNADLRSGSPRPFPAPSFKQVANAGDKGLFVYRGHFYTSSTYRDYVATIVAGNEHVFWTESGQKPQKQVNGVQVDLGTPAPLIGPTIAESDSLSPSFLTLTPNKSGSQVVTVWLLLNGTTIASPTRPPFSLAIGQTTIYFNGVGNLKAGTVSYRVAAETADGIMPASYKATVGVTAGSNVFLEWGFVPGVIKWHIYGRSEDKEAEITTIPGSDTHWIDYGDLQPTGSLASSYDQSEPVAYFYTYRRKVGGIIDESAPSAVTNRVQPSKARRVTRQVLSDGYFTQAGTITLTNGVGGVALSLSSAAYTAVTIASAAYNSGLQQVEFTTTLPHGFSTNDSVLLQNFGDAIFNQQNFPIIKLSTTKFAIKNAPLPSDASYTTQSATKNACRLTITGSTSAPLDKDAIYLSISNANYSKQSGLYKASVTSGNIEIPFAVSGTVTVDSVKFINNNNYYSSWCLYRTGGGVAEWQLVKEVDIWNGYFDDGVIPSKLGGPPDSYYEEGGITVIYDVPPKGMEGIEQHYAMLFAIDGHDVRWTPTLRPDAWPTAFKFNFGFKPMKLASFGQALIVLCEDAIYRIDGNTPTGLSVSKTNAHDGCIAPHSVQKTTRGLIYLSRRGLMLFDGVNAVCITDTRIPSRFWSAPSRFKAGETPTPFWWFPTMKKREYMELAWSESIDPEVADAVRWYQDVPIDGLRDSIRSFYHLGRYFLYWAGGSGNDYEGNTCMYLDLEQPGYPIFSLGMKALDVCVDENQTPYALFGNHGGIGKSFVVNITSPTGTPGDKDFGPDGKLYIPYGSCIVKVDTAAGTYSLFAGDYSLTGHTDATGTAARFSNARACRWSTDGNLYVVDTAVSLGVYTNYIRKITAAGVVTTLCTIPSTTDPILALAVRPTNGYLYTADYNQIWEITLAGAATAVAGTFGNQGHLDGTGTAALLSRPSSMDFDSTGSTLYFYESGSTANLASIRTMTVPGYVVATSIPAFPYSRPISIRRKNTTTFLVMDDLGDQMVYYTPSTGLVTAFEGIGYINDVAPCYDASLNIFAFANAPSLYKIFGTDSSASNFTALYGAEATMSASPSLVPTDSIGVYRLFAFNQNIPLHIRTGAMSFGQPHERKNFRHIEFHGKGTLTVRIYVDGVLVTDTEMVINAETPSSERRLNLPRGGTKGYALDIEFSGDASLSVVEIAWVPMPGVS